MDLVPRIDGEDRLDGIQEVAGSNPGQLHCRSQ
jgi:hypothetical protein